MEIHFRFIVVMRRAGVAGGCAGESESDWTERWSFLLTEGHDWSGRRLCRGKWIRFDWKVVITSHRRSWLEWQEAAHGKMNQIGLKGGHFFSQKLMTGVAGGCAGESDWTERWSFLLTEGHDWSGRRLRRGKWLDWKMVISSHRRSWLEWQEAAQGKVIGLKGGHVFSQKVMTSDHVPAHLCKSADGRFMPSMVIFQVLYMYLCSIIFNKIKQTNFIPY